MLEKYRQELLHIKMVDALEHAHVEDRINWLREASFAGTVFDPRVSFDRSPVEGTLFAMECGVHQNTFDRGNWADCHCKGRLCLCQSSSFPQAIK
jgi:hypothetical protein